MNALEQLISRQALRRTRPPLCPEFELWLAPEPVPLWETLEALTGRREGPPFWAHAWPGSLALARFVLDEPALVSGQHVLDFASGCGVSAVAAVRSGAARVLATDIDPHAVSAMGVNASLNSCAFEASPRDVIGLDEAWDTVLVGDVFYEAGLSQRVLSWLQQLAHRGAAVLIGDPGRSFLPKEHLTAVSTYPFTPNHAWDSVSDRPPSVWRLR